MASFLTEDEKFSIEHRQGYNFAILKKLKEFFIDNPDIRFGQALIILGICEDTGNLFNEESIVTFVKAIAKKRK